MCVCVCVRACFLRASVCPDVHPTTGHMTTTKDDSDDAVTRAHAGLTASAKQQSASESSLVNGVVSRHTLPATVSFSNLAALHSAVKDSNKLVPQFDFVASSAGALVFSSRFRYAPPPPPMEAAGEKSRKRRRDAGEAHEDRVSEARKQLAKLLPESVPKSELDVAESVLISLLTELRGPSRELLIQSYALLTKKLESSDERPRVVLALRLQGGVGVPVSHLKRCLGVCWKDGLLSTEPTVAGVDETDLPLSQEGRVSKDLGNLPLLLVTSVPMSMS